MLDTYDSLEWEKKDNEDEDAEVIGACDSDKEEEEEEEAGGWTDEQQQIWIVIVKDGSYPAAYPTRPQANRRVVGRRQADRRRCPGGWRGRERIK
jgi:hypothetical protein